MKFLTYRDKFLENQVDFHNQIKTSTLITEQYFQNDIRFGDSLFGRLINSTIQSLVTGVKSITIPFLLKSLESQLRLMVDRVGFEQINKEYPTLFLKSNLERIKIVCESTQSEEEKLKILIGWDGKTPLYDVNDPYADVKGFYENRKLTSSLVQEIYDDISDPNKRPGLEKAFNPNVIKGFLDTLSNFMDDLRKLTSNVDVSSASSKDTPFENEDLRKALQRLTQINLTRESKLIKPLSYLSFINESEDESTESVDNLQKLILIAKSKTPNIEQFKQIYQSLNDKEKEILKRNNLLSVFDNLLKESYYFYIKSTLDGLNELYTTSTGGLPIITGTPSSTTSTTGGSTPSSTIGSTPSATTTSSIKPILQPSSTSSVTPTPPSKPENVKEVWGKFFSKVDKILPAKMTQEDINRLKSFSPKDIDFKSSITKNPNPLFKIIRIFENANSVFTTNSIPSGRMGGEVWPITYNRYQYVGSGSPGGPEKPGPGPWVHKPLFKQWYQGVMELMSKTEYSEIFPSVEATNLKKESLSLILEKEQPTESKTDMVSRKLILQEFMVDMLNIKNQGDFGDFASKAMKRFFGLNVDPSNLSGERNVSVQQPEIDKENIVDNSFIWENFKKTTFDPNDLNKFYVFPIQDQRKNKGLDSYKIIFIRPLKLTGKFVEVKCTFDNQEEANIVMSDSIFQNYKKTDFSCESPKGNVYYGVMLNDFKDGIKICYANIKDSNSSSFKASDFYGEPSSVGNDVFKFSNYKIRLKSGEEKSIDRSKLVRYDDKKTKQEVKKDLVKVYNEKSDEKLRDLPTTKAVNLFDALSNLGKNPEFKFWS